MFYAANYPASLKLILELFPEHERLAVVTEEYLYSDTVLPRAKYRSEVLQVILSSLRKEDRPAAAKAINNSDSAVLHKAVNHPELLKVMLELLSAKDILAVVIERGNDGETFLHEAVNNPDSLKVILESLPDQGKVAALKTKNGDGLPVLHSAANYPGSLTVIFESLSKPDWLTVLQEKDNDGDTLLACAAVNPASLKVILDTLPASWLYSAVNFKMLKYTLSDLMQISPSYSSLLHERLFGEELKANTNRAPNDLIDEGLGFCKVVDSIDEPITALKLLLHSIKDVACTTHGLFKGNSQGDMKLAKEFFDKMNNQELTSPAQAIKELIQNLSNSDGKLAHMLVFFNRQYLQSEAGGFKPGKQVDGASSRI